MNSRKTFVPPDLGIKEPSSRNTYSPENASTDATNQDNKKKNGDCPQSLYMPLEIARNPEPKIRLTNKIMVESTPKCRPCGASSGSWRKNTSPPSIGRRFEAEEFDSKSTDSTDTLCEFSFLYDISGLPMLWEKEYVVLCNHSPSDQLWLIRY